MAHYPASMSLKYFEELPPQSLQEWVRLINSATARPPPFFTEEKPVLAAQGHGMHGILREVIVLPKPSISVNT